MTTDNSRFLRYRNAALILFRESSMACSHQLDITFPCHIVHNTITRPSKPLRVTYPLLSRRRLWPAVTSSTVPATATSRPILRNDSREEAQLSTGFRHLILNSMAKATLIYRSHGECRNRYRGSPDPRQLCQLRSDLLKHVLGHSGEIVAGRPVPFRARGAVVHRIRP